MPEVHQPGYSKVDAYLSIYRLDQPTQDGLLVAAQVLSQHLSKNGVGLIVVPLKTDRSIYVSMLTLLSKQGIQIIEDKPDLIVDLLAMAERRRLRLPQYESN